MKEQMLENEWEARLGSTFMAVERFLEQEPSVRQELAANHKASHLIPTTGHWDTLWGPKAGLAPVSELDLTDTVFGQLTM